MSSAVINVKQIASYPQVSLAGPNDLLLLQPGGLGNSYASIAATDLVTAALSSGVTLQLAPGNATITSDGFTFSCNTTFSAVSLQADVVGASSITAVAFIQNGDPVATIPEMAAAFNNLSVVNSFNQRTGDVVLETDDILRAGGAPQVNAHFAGWITAPSPWDPALDDDTVATTRWSQRAMCQFFTNWLELQPLVFSFNGRSGNITLTTADINSAYATLDGTYPTAPNPVLGDASSRIATTLFVDESLQDLHSTVSNEWTAADNTIYTDLTTNYAPLASPAFTGVPTAPTANPGANTGQLATTAFVTHAVSASTAGVSSFNTRTGAVTLAATDVTGAGGALLNSPAFTGSPTAPTLSPGTSNTGLATTAFVAAAVTAGTAGVSSFNTRTGAVTLTLTDVTATGILASPVLTGVPVAPTATTGTTTTQLATTQFVANAITSMTAGVSSFNSRTGAVTLQGSDVSAAGGALVASPTFTGTPAAPTAVAGTNTTQIATTQFVQSALTTGVVTTFNGRAGTVTLTTADVTGAGGAPLASPSMTGVPTAPTATAGNSTTQLATTAFVGAAISAIPAGVTSFNTRTGAVSLTLADVTGAGGAPIASPTFTGVPAGPTAAPGTSTTQLATTAFVAAASAAPPVLRSYLSGLTLSTAGSSATFAVSPGVAADSTNATMMNLAASISKTTSAWAVGTGNGALDTGTIANSTWYNVHLIERTDTSVVDVLISLSPTAPTMPANYTRFRRIGSMLTSASGQWVLFIQNGNLFLWSVRVADVSAVSTPTTATLITLTVARGVQVEALFNGHLYSTGTTQLLYTSPDESDQTPSAAVCSLMVVGAGGSTDSAALFRVRTNTSGQIRVRSAGTASQYYIITTGWYDTRGRDL